VKKVKVPPHWLVIWRDASSPSSLNAWLSKEDVDAKTVMEPWTVGWIVSENKDRIGILQTIVPGHDVQTGVLYIPKACIVTRQRIKLVLPKEAKAHGRRGTGGRKSPARRKWKRPRWSRHAPG
jgi:hypothetical protein